MSPESKGKGSPAVSPESKGKGSAAVRPESKGKGSAAVSPESKGKGSAAVSPESKGKGSAAVSPSSKGKGSAAVSPSSKGSAAVSPDAKGNGASNKGKGQAPGKGKCKGKGKPSSKASDDNTPSPAGILKRSAGSEIKETPDRSVRRRVSFDSAVATNTGQQANPTISGNFRSWLPVLSLFGILIAIIEVFLSPIELQTLKCSALNLRC